MISIAGQVGIIVGIGLVFGLLFFIFLFKKFHKEAGFCLGVIAFIISFLIMGIGVSYKQETKEIKFCKTTNDGQIIVTYTNDEIDEFSSKNISYKTINEEGMYLTIEETLFHDKRNLVLSADEETINKIRGITEIK